MADARYVIDVILKAHDATTEAFAKATGNLKAFEKIQEDLNRKSEDFNRKFEEGNRRLTVSSEKLKGTLKDLGNDGVLFGQKMNDANREVAASSVELERASENYVKTLRNVNSTEQERIKALGDLNKSYTDLKKTIDEQNKGMEEADRKNAAEHARKIKANALERADLQEQTKLTQQLAAETEKANERKLASEKKLADEQRRIRQEQIRGDQEVGRKRQQQAKETEKQISLLNDSMRTQARQLAREDVGSKRFDDLRQSIANTRREMASLTGDSRSALREQKRAFDDAGVSIDKHSLALGREGEAIKRNAREYRNYFNAVNEAAEARKKLKSAGSETERLVFKAEKDDKSWATFMAAKKLAARDIEVNMELDIGNALAKLEAVNIAQNKVEHNNRSLIGSLGILRASFGDSFANMEGSVARFDNVMRGAFTLLITFFLPQLIVLAGAAGGALLALGSSAAFAAGAIGGSLVAGIGQALPVLGVFATALSRVKNITDAVKQANLAQQQQSTRGAAQTRTSANAENTLTNALEQQKSAQENIVQAQERVTQARADAKRQLEDLILAEKRANLSVGEAQDALRDAIQSGQAGEIESRRLDLEEARLRAQRTKEDANKAQKTGDPGGQVEAATRALKDAQLAAERAQRATENARRSSEGAAAGVTAAAGKLEFLQAQMSKSERALFNALTTLQNRFREFAKDISAPLIDSFTDATKRMTSLLGDSRIINAAKNLSKAMAREFSATTDAFTSGRGLQQQIFLTKEAEKNMSLFGRTVRAVGKSFLDIAVAASPTFRTLGRLIANAAENFQEFTGSARGQREMGEFFEKGVVHLRAWIGLLGAIVRLFAAIAGEGGGARTGLQLINSMTKAINEFTDSVNKKGSDANKFFRDLFTVTKLVGQALGPVLHALGKELASIFGEEAGSGGAAVKSFATITTKILIPALGQFLRVMIQIGGSLGKFLEANPTIAKMASSFAALAIAFGVLSKAWTLIFGPLKALTLGFVNLITKIRALGLGLDVLKAGGIAGIVIAVILLLHKFGQLDDLWRALQRSLRSLRAPFNQLIDAFKDLKDAFGLSGKQGDKFLEVLAKIIRIGLEVYIKLLALTLGNLFRSIATGIKIIAGLVRIFHGLLDIIIGIFTLDPKQMLKGFGEIGDGLKGIFNGVLDFFKGWIGQIAELFGGLPAKVLEFGKDVASAFVEGMKGLPGALFKALTGIVSGPLALGGVLARLIDKALPDKIKLPGLPDVNLPDNPLKDVGAYAQGGAVPGSGEGDTVFARLTPGEHVWTKSEVAAAGGHGALYALRSLFGGGGQSRGGGYAEGGAVGGGRAGNAEDIAASSLDGLLHIIDAGGDKIVNSWKKTWENFNEVTHRGRVLATREFRAIQDMVETRMERTKEIATNRASRLRKNVLEHFENLTRGVRKGLVYVARNVNTALDSFGAKPSKVSVDTPPNLQGAATGGWIGRPGERGRDAIPVMLGRGEAVLNWGHQKVVNSALWNQYGQTLDTMFGRTSGYHAGGPGEGMAGGGFTGPHGTGEGFNPITNFANRKFNLQMTAGKDDHSYLTTSGNVSDHSLGIAGDFSNGVLTPQEDAFSNFWLHKAPGVIKQLIWRNKDQQQGFYVAGHEDHVHLAVQQQYAFNAAKIAKIISRASRGLSIASLLSGGSFDVDHLDKIKVGGDSKLADLARSGLSRVVKQANKFIDKIASRFAPAGFGPSHAGSYDGPLDHTFSDPNTTVSFGQAVSLAKRAGFPDSVAELFGHIAQSESTLRPGIVNSIGATGLWQIYNHPDLVSKYGDMRNPWNNAQAAYELWRQGGTAPWVSSQAGWGQYAATGGYPNGIPSFDVGGIVPGSQVGSPTLIQAHAGEWVVNPQQQSKLAGLVGATASQIKDFLGFTGGPTSFQGGGEVGATTGFVTEAERRQQIRKGRFIFPSFPIETFNQISRAFDQANRALRNAAVHIKENIHVRTERYLKAMQQITGENGLLDILSARIERHTQQLATQFLRSQFVVGARRGRRTVFRRFREGEEGFQTDDQLAEDAIANQIRIFNELNTNQKRIKKLLGSIKKQDERLRKRIAELRKNGVTEREADIIEDLQGQRVTLRSERAGLRERLEEVKQAIAEQIQAIYEARVEQIRKLADQADRPVQVADNWERILSAIGFATSAAINFRIGAIKQQISGLQTALAQAQKIGDQELIQDLQDRLAEAGVALFESQQDLIRATAEEAIAANERYLSRSGIVQRMQEVLGQSTVGTQQSIIAGLKIQVATINEQIRLAYAAGNVGLAKELEDQALETQATLIEAQQALFQTMIDSVNEVGRAASFQTDLRNRLADVMQRGGNAIGAAQLREQILAAQRVNISALMQSLQTILNQQLQLPVTEQNQTLITQLTEQIGDLGVQLEENTIAVSDAANATRDAMIAAIQQPAAFQTGIFGQLGSILQSLSNITGQDTTGQQRTMLENVAEILSGQGTQLRQQLLNWLGIDLLGLSGTEFVSAVSNIDWAALTEGMTEAERTTFESLINAIIENELSIQQNTEALDGLSSTLAPQDFASTAWQWFRQAIFSGSGGLLPQFQPPGLAEGGTVLRTGMALVHEGEWFINPKAGNSPSTTNGDINLQINEVGGPVDVEHLVSRLAWEQQGRRR